MKKFFQLEENGTTVATEALAGVTTFFTMAYILFVNPSILSATGMPYQAVFLATILASIVGTMLTGLLSNVPYAQAPGMGLNAFFTYTVVFALGFTWQQALALVFICGIVGIIITVTSIRKAIIVAIPKGIQHAIGGGIGIFVAYIGIKNANFLQFTSDNTTLLSVNGQAFDAAGSYEGIFAAVTNGGIIPALVHFDNPSVLLALIGLILTIVMTINNVKGGILISIFITTLIGIPMGVVDVSSASISLSALGESISQLGVTFGAAFGPEGIQTLFSDPSKIVLVIMTILAFTLTDVFDTIGTFIGTGRRTGIFTDADIEQMSKGTGFKSKIERALFADVTATAVGAIIGTSNVTTYVESAAGIAAGGRTGLTSVFVSVCFLLSTLLAPVAGLVPAAATAPALIVVGIMMLGSFKDVNWADFEEAVPSFFAGVFMALCYSITYGIAGAFIFYCIVKAVRGKAKEVHPIIWICSALFVVNFILLSTRG